MSWNEVKQSSVALLAVPLAAASVLLAGCGGDAKPGASSSSTTGASPTLTTAAPTTPSPTTSPSATAIPTRTTDPNIPAAARAHTPAGAEAFVRYFYSQANIAWTKPSSGLVLALSAPSCKSCSALEATAADLVKKGHHYDGPPATIVFVGHLGESSAALPEILVRLTQEHRSVIDSSGHVVLTDQREPAKFVATLRWSGRGWLVETVKSLA